MNYYYAFLISVAAGLTVLFIKYIVPMISGLFSSIPCISGNWVATFTEPTEKQSVTENMLENVTLHQVGRLVWGQGTVADNKSRIFKYRGRIYRETFSGTYWREAQKASTGRGTFHLKLSGNDKKMEGWCLWHDEDTENIEASEYTWKKK